VAGLSSADVQVLADALRSQITGKRAENEAVI
jgi:hypothetical protein